MDHEPEPPRHGPPPEPVPAEPGPSGAKPEGDAVAPPRTGPADGARGFLMGLADVVPGVSGGTIALILGIYDRFINSVAAIDARLLRRAGGLGRPGGARRLWHHMRRTDLLFLAWIGTGMLLAIFSASHGVGWLLENHPVPLMALFLGLILASARLPWRRIDDHRGATWIALAGGIGIAAVASRLPAFSTAPPSWFLVVAGFLAVSVMLLPGISGSSLLVIFGVYEGILAAVRGPDLVAIFFFATGAVAGFAVASRALRRLLHRHSDTTHAALTGLMIGSLVRLWPWRDTPGFAMGDPVLPSGFDETTTVALAVTLAGVFLSWGLEWLGRVTGQGPQRKNG